MENLSARGEERRRRGPYYDTVHVVLGALIRAGKEIV